MGAQAAPGTPSQEPGANVYLRIFQSLSETECLYQILCIRLFLFSLVRTSGGLSVSECLNKTASLSSLSL